MSSPVTGLEVVRFAMAVVGPDGSAARMLYATTASPDGVPFRQLAGFAFQHDATWYAVDVDACIGLFRVIGNTGSVHEGLDCWKRSLRVAGVTGPTLAHAADAAGMEL